MSNDLERRRRAIVEALRQIMAEPLPGREPAPALDRPKIVFVDARSGTSTETVDEAAALAARDLIMTSEWDAEEFAEPDDSPGSPIVPAMEPIGAMSRTASLALFGHA